MQVDLKSFDYSIILTQQEVPKIFDSKPDFDNSDVEFSFENKGEQIIIYSRIKIPFMGRDRIKVYHSKTHFKIPYEQHISHLEDSMKEVDELVLGEFVLIHLGIQFQNIYSETGGYIVQLPSLYRIHSIINQLGDAMNN